ncbi:MAG: hypothetical protein K1W34_07340 [Lachnospiraceae bacterium]
MEKVDGSMEVLSAMQVTADMEGLDAQSRLILHSKEVLAIILKETTAEYKDYSKEEIMEFIEADSVTSLKEVSPGRTNTTVKGDSAEFVMLNEKVSFFDLLFRAKNPGLSTEDVQIDLHIDVEPQKTYKPGYPIEKRGMYYLARSLSSQLSLVTNNTDYGRLEKCLSIWICRDDVPQDMRYSISTYEVVNTKNTCVSTVEKENYDLMTLIVIKLGNEVYNGEKGDEGYELLRFLNILMYPHKNDFMDTVKEYIDFSNNEELWKENDGMIGFGQTILEEGIRRGEERNARTIAEKDTVIAEKDTVIAQQDIVIAEKDAVIAQQERELALLRKLVS